MLCVGCGTSAYPNLRDSNTIVDATSDNARDSGVIDAMDAGVDSVDAPTNDEPRADAPAGDVPDRVQDAGVIIRDAASDGRVGDAECNGLAPLTVNRDCQRALGLTQDPGAWQFACCSGVCEIGNCGQGGRCAGAPCSAAAGQLCCINYARALRCVPRDRGLCSIVP